jgi:hypothetical protein
VDVNAVEYWAGDAFLVLGHSRRRAGIRLDRIAKPTTRAGIPAIEQIFHAK